MTTTWRPRPASPLLDAKATEKAILKSRSFSIQSGFRLNLDQCHRSAVRPVRHGHQCRPQWRGAAISFALMDSARRARKS
jgi:hypothetical protein